MIYINHMNRNSNSRSTRSGNNREDSQLQKVIVDINNVESIITDIKKQLTTAKIAEVQMQNRIEFLENVILTLTGIKN